MATATNTAVNGLPSPATTEKAPSVKSPPRIVLAGKTGRILCVADIRGDYHELNRLIREHEATAVIHTGDFGFLNQESLPRMGDKILRHLLQYSPLIPPATRSQILAIPQTEPRETLLAALSNAFIHFPLSQFPHLLTGAITFPVPVFTVYGLIEDVRILERFRTGEYQVQNLTVIDEACSRLIETSGVKLRLFGLGGAVAMHKLFDHGEGTANIAGQNGTMWATTLQMGELMETAQRTFDPTETRIFLSSAPIGRSGILALLASRLQADITISGGLHFRHHSSFNNFAVNSEFDSFRAQLQQAQKSFMDVYASVKERVDHSMTPGQRTLLQKALAAVENLPNEDDQIWMNTWNWVLVDASCGHLLLSINDGRIGCETKSHVTFGHRAVQSAGPPTTQPTAVALPPAGRAIQETNSAKAAPIARPPGINAATKPAPQNAPAVTVPAGAKPGPVRPLQQAAGAKPPGNPSAAAPTGPSQNQTSIPARPPTQPRQARGALAPTGGTKVESVQSKSPAPVPSKGATPAQSAQANGRPAATPVTAAKIPEKSKAAAAPVAPATAKKDDPVANGAKQDKEEGKTEDKPKEESSEQQASDKPADGAETPDEEKPRPSKKHALFLRGIPVPTSEEEIRALFDHPEKIGSVKIITDRATGKQKNIAYVDYDKEEDMKEALGKHRNTIRETTIEVLLSTPPAPRFGRFDGGGGMRGGRGAGGGFSRGGRGPRGGGFGGNAGNSGNSGNGGNGGNAGNSGGNNAPRKENKE